MTLFHVSVPVLFISSVSSSHRVLLIALSMYAVGYTTSSVLGTYAEKTLKYVNSTNGTVICVLYVKFRDQHAVTTKRTLNAGTTGVPNASP